MLKEGSAAPAFKTKDATGETVNLKDLRGQKVVLYFYPKDDTPGCTKEACSFRDAFSQFKKKGIAVLGVSPDSEASHQKFVTKYKLPFTLLADTDRSIDRRGLWCLGREEVYGTNIHGCSPDHLFDR
jgi:peroxiredoxin Q/BCP